MALGVVFSVAMFLWTQLSMLTFPGWHWSSFRIFGSGDQLSYFAEVLNGSHGNLAAVEPYTETGVNSDPHLYYQLLGGIAYLTHISAADVWNVAAVALQVLLIISISIACALFTRRWWASFFGTLPFLLGTLSFTSQGWYTLMQSHAVLWGAFAVMFPLNSESASLAIAGSLIVFLLVMLRQYTDARRLTFAGLLVGAGIGLLANFHTYGFLIAVFFGAYGLALYAIALRKRPWLYAVTLLLIVALFIVGPTIAASAGRLAALALGIVPALPGIVVAIVEWRLRIIAALAVTFATASPQVVNTWIALRHGNAFLKYREASTVNLGVSWQDGLISALPLLIPLTGIAIAGFHRKRPIWIAYALGASVSWFLLAKNDVWGTNQEPYRLWIDGFALTAFTILPVAIDVVLAYLPKSQDWAPSWPWRALFAAFTAATLIVGGISSIDWFRFYKSQEDQTMSLYTPQDQAMRAVAAKLTNKDLVLTGPCIVEETFKAVTGAPVDYFSPGLAWPARLKEMTTFSESLAAGDIEPSLLKAARIGWLVTDGNCTADWHRRYAPLLTKISSSRYGPDKDVITLWRFRAS